MTEVLLLSRSPSITAKPVATVYYWLTFRDYSGSGYSALRCPAQGARQPHSSDGSTLALLPRCILILARRRAGLCFPVSENKIVRISVTTLFAFSEEKYDNLHTARGMDNPAATPSFLHRPVCRAIYLCCCADRHAICGDAATGRDYLCSGT